MTEVTPLSERVVVALNVLRHDIDILELAALWAAQKQAQLLAVYVEEANLFNLVELPFAIEIDRISATERKVDLPRLMRSLRSSTEQIQQALDRLNERLQIDIRFRTIRGHFASAVMSEIEPVDIVFLSKRTELSRGRIARKTTIYPIWVVFDGSKGSERALQMAADLAELKSSRLYIALPAKNDEESEALKRRAMDCCGQNAAIHFVSVYPFDVPNLLHSMRRTGCRLLVVKRQDDELSKALAEALPCPVVLV